MNELKRIFEILNMLKHGSIRNNIRFCDDWADIFSFSMLISFIVNNDIKNLEFQFKNSDVRNFLVRMGIKNFVKVNYEDYRDYHNPFGRFIEFKNFSSCNQVDLYVKEIQGILKKANLQKEDINAVVFISQELMDNVIRHANSPRGGLLCGMVYPKKKKVEFSIVDCGVGFKGSLSKREIYKNLSDTEAIKIAITREDEEGTCDIYNGGGNGLPYSWKLVKKAGGNLTVISGQAIFNNGKIQKIDEFKWSGVAIRFSFPLENLKSSSIIEIFGYEDIGFPDEDEFCF